MKMMRRTRQTSTRGVTLMSEVKAVRESAWMGCLLHVGHRPRGLRNLRGYFGALSAGAEAAPSSRFDTRHSTFDGSVSAMPNVECRVSNVESTRRRESRF